MAYRKEESEKPVKLLQFSGLGDIRKVSYAIMKDTEMGDEKNRNWLEERQRRENVSSTRFPVVVWKIGSTTYQVSIPDLPGCFSDPFDFLHLIDQASSCARSWGIRARERGEDIPQPSSSDELEEKADIMEVLGFIEVDDTGMVMGHDTIPLTLSHHMAYVLRQRAKDAGKTPSEFVADLLCRIGT